MKIRTLFCLNKKLNQYLNNINFYLKRPQRGDLMVKIITPQKECKYLETCNLQGIVPNCNIFSQKTDKCIIFKLMNEVQELMNFKRGIENKKMFHELIEPHPQELF